MGPEFQLPDPVFQQLPFAKQYFRLGRERAFENCTAADTPAPLGVFCAHKMAAEALLTLNLAGSG